MRLKNGIPLIPPDDSGSDSFSRFKYQAKAIFPFFLRCGLGGEECAVIAEHVEDVVIEYPDRFIFLQIKTRDAARGMWTLTDLLGGDGALHSLYRAYKYTRKLAATYELLLEQPCSPNGNMNLLRRGGGQSLDPRLIEQVRAGLSITKKECAAFLLRVRLRSPPPTRPEIDATNLRLLGAQAPQLRQVTIAEIYAKCLSRIEDAMCAASLGQEWPSYMIEPTAKGKLKAKTLSRGDCAGCLLALKNTVGALLTRTMDDSHPAPTNLQAKLLAASAPKQLVDDAVRLRALAAYAEYTHLAGSLPVAQRELEDVQERLRIRALAIVALLPEVNPASNAWKELLAIVHGCAAQLDPNCVYAQDPMLLLGAICGLSDQCLVDWRPNA